jgi:hypothetical protein
MKVFDLGHGGGSKDIALGKFGFIEFTVGEHVFHVSEDRGGLRVTTVGFKGIKVIPEVGNAVRIGINE